MSINVAIIDDQDIIRLGVQQSLSQVPHITFVGEFSSLEAFCDSTISRKAGVVLLDDSLPDVDVQQAIQIIQHHCPEVAVLLLGAWLTASDIHAAIGAGASGVVCKSDPLQDVLVMGIRHAHAGRVYLSPRATLIALRLGAVPDLNKCLYEVLCLMASGYRVPDMVRKLGISRKAVYARRTRLREILGVDTNEQIVSEAMRRRLLDDNV